MTVLDEQSIFKVLDGRRPCHGGTGTWEKGRWRRVRGPLVPCERGLHVCRGAQVIDWLGPDLWLAEVRGEVIDDGSKLVVAEARIVERLDGWTERAARLFAADCAEHVLPIFEAVCPGDMRPREAIMVVRRYADGDATPAEMWAAAAAARDAWDAVGRAAAAVIARTAAWAAAAAAAVAWDAQAAGRDALAAAARTAADAAARAAAWAAAERDLLGLVGGYERAGRLAGRAAERDWQYARLCHYLTGEAT